MVTDQEISHGESFRGLHLVDPMPKLRPIHLALFALVSAYVATTGLGAALISTRFGREQLTAFMYPESVPFSWLTTIGTPVYWLILVSLIIIVPAVALPTEQIVERFAPTTKAIDVPTWIPLLIAGFLSTFCIYKLAMVGGLTAHEVWDRSVCFAEKMERRTQLFGLLNNQFYSFCYSSLPILASFLLAKFIINKDRIAAIGFALVSILLTWFYIAMIMKAPIIIYIGVVALTLVLCGIGIMRTITITAPIAVTIYLALSVLQFCNHQAASWSVDVRSNPNAESELAHRAEGELPHRAEGELPHRAEGELPHREGKSFIYKALYMTRAVTLRMAASFPYYVQEFSEPTKKCGLEVPPVPLLPRQRCFPPTKIFNLMYPSINYIQGYAPAPSNVSAYSELGIGYSFVAMVIAGIIIGTLSFFARGQNPLSVSLAVTTCVYSYYLTQVSLSGSIFDSYGLLWMLLPLALAILINFVWNTRQSFRNSNYIG